VALRRGEGVVFETPLPAAPPDFDAVPLGLGFDERMEGHVHATRVAPANRDAFRALETAGHPSQAIVLALHVETPNLARLIEDQDHRMQVTGTLSVILPGTCDSLPYEVRGSVALFVERVKPYGLGRRGGSRRALQTRLAGPYRTVKARKPTKRRSMVYDLHFLDRANRRWHLRGVKEIHDDPGLDAWRDTSHLFVTLMGPATDQADDSPADLTVRAAGVAHVGLSGFLMHQLPSIRVIGCDDDPARALWAKVRFASFFFGELQRIYLPNVKTFLETFFKLNPSNVRRTP
jgi:hypothetical protein